MFIIILTIKPYLFYLILGYFFKDVKHHGGRRYKYATRHRKMLSLRQLETLRGGDDSDSDEYNDTLTA